jgi:hypothetical protein
MREQSINAWRLQTAEPVYLELSFYHKYFHEGKARLDDVRLLGLLLAIVDKSLGFALTDAHDLYLLRGGDNVRSIQSALLRLEDQGWITRAKSVNDGRYFRITVSPKFGFLNVKDRVRPEANHE